MVGPESFLAVAARINAGRKQLALRVTEEFAEQVGARGGSCEDRDRRLAICLARRKWAQGARRRAGSHAGNGGILRQGLQESCGGDLLRRFKHLTLSLLKKCSGALAGSPECVDENLADRVEMVCLAHTSRELSSVLPAVGEHDELADVFTPLGRDVAKKRVREHLRDFLEAGLLAADPRPDSSAAQSASQRGASRRDEGCLRPGRGGRCIEGT